MPPCTPPKGATVKGSSAWRRPAVCAAPGSPGPWQEATTLQGGPDRPGANVLLLATSAASVTNSQGAVSHLQTSFHLLCLCGWRRPGPASPAKTVARGLVPRGARGRGAGLASAAQPLTCHSGWFETQCPQLS